MENLRIALKAFWHIFRNRPHVYCDNNRHSIVGTVITAELHINVLVAALNLEVEQQEALNELKSFINDQKPH